MPGIYRQLYSVRLHIVHECYLTLMVWYINALGHVKLNMLIRVSLGTLWYKEITECDEL